ncbi:MAG: hypothetical protein M1816_005368 [Peltula sp. TS41687]|nr:MAG: hypothetical protein M1816_005368 [Peltula sp. TS41687]
MRALTFWPVAVFLAAISATGAVKETPERERGRGRRFGRDNGGNGEGGGSVLPGAQRPIPFRLPGSPPVDSILEPTLQLLACEKMIHRTFREEGGRKISIVPGGTEYEYQFQRYIHRELNERCIPGFWKKDGWARAGLYSGARPPLEIEKEAFAARFPLQRPEFDDSILIGGPHKYKRKQVITEILRDLNEELISCVCSEGMFQPAALPTLRTQRTFSEKTQELKVKIKREMLDRSTRRLNEVKYNEQKKCIKQHQTRVKTAINDLRGRYRKSSPGAMHMIRLSGILRLKK